MRSAEDAPLAPAGSEPGSKTYLRTAILAAALLIVLLFGIVPIGMLAPGLDGPLAALAAPAALLIAGAKVRLRGWTNWILAGLAFTGLPLLISMAFFVLVVALFPI